MQRPACTGHTEFWKPKQRKEDVVGEVTGLGHTRFLKSRFFDLSLRTVEPLLGFYQWNDRFRFGVCQDLLGCRQEAWSQEAPFCYSDCSRRTDHSRPEPTYPGDDVIWCLDWLRGPEHKTLKSQERVTRLVWWCREAGKCRFEGRNKLLSWRRGRANSCCVTLLNL